ncbi:MAG: hypothetical protein E6Q67_14265 [Roseateles sp.]|nr:MAG: hypothetical protein E6Q67_14265 [Roseateles sp.]
MRFAEFQRADLTDALHDALTAELEAALPEVCGLLARHALAALANAAPLKHLSRPALANCAVRITYQFMHTHGGYSHYFPSGRELKRSDRDRLLISKFEGNNLKELSREFGISEMRVRQILWKHFPPSKRPRKA